MSDKLVVTPVQRSRLSEQIVIQLCQMIGQGQLQPGDRLPPERDLADRLQVSRASLREALRAMELAGIVTTRHGGGTVVREFANDGLLSPLLLLLNVRDDLVGDLLEARLIFEPETAARAAVRATADDLAALERIIRRQQELLGADPGAPWLQLDRQFHIALARASRNEVAVRLTSYLMEMLPDAARHFVASSERLERAMTRHQQIIHAVRAGDAQHAREAMLHHLREVEEFVLRAVVADDRAAQRAAPA